MGNAIHIEGSVALVTGAGRGFGLAVVESLLDGGASKVYAGARDPGGLEDLRERHGDRLVPVRLDVTDPDQVAEVARRATDVTLLVNNAGAFEPTELTDAAIVDVARREIEVNYLGALRMVQSFAATLAANGGSIVNVASVAGLVNIPLQPTYSASKAAQHSLTQVARAVLAGQGVGVHGVYPGPIDTEMTKDLPPEFAKTPPEVVAANLLTALEAGTEDIFPDPFSEGFGAQYFTAPKDLERQLAGLAQA